MRQQDRGARSAPTVRGRRPGWARRHHEPYSTLSVVVTTIALACVPLLAVTHHHRIAVLWLACLVLGLSVVRVLRPEGTWIAARSRLFDAAFGIILVLGLVLLSPYAELSHVP